MDLVIIILTGIVGGIVNCLLLEKGRFPLPYLVKDGDKTIIDPGGLGNMAFGIVASIIIFGLGADEVSTWKQISICLLSAAAGGNFITSMIQKENMNKEIKKSQALKEAADEAIKTIGKFASDKKISISDDKDISDEGE